MLFALGDSSGADAGPEGAAAEGGQQADSTTPAVVQQQQPEAQAPGAGSDSPRQPPTPGAASDAELEADGFVPADGFEGARPGYAFKLGEQGLGYYPDPCASTTGARQGGSSSQQEEEGAPAVNGSGEAQRQGDGLLVGTSTPGEQAAPQPLPPGPRHHWGQALQYLDRAVAVQPGRRLALLARREEGRLRFSLRQGVGEAVGRSPWKVEWGGGSSVENPHYQRVHYCQLLVRGRRGRRGMHFVVAPAAGVRALGLRVRLYWLHKAASLPDAQSRAGTAQLHACCLPTRPSCPLAILPSSL